MAIKYFKYYLRYFRFVHTHKVQMSSACLSGPHLLGNWSRMAFLSLKITLFWWISISPSAIKNCHFIANEYPVSTQNSCFNSSKSTGLFNARWRFIMMFFSSVTCRGPRTSHSTLHLGEFAVGQHRASTEMETVRTSAGFINISVSPWDSVSLFY